MRSWRYINQKRLRYERKYINLFRALLKSQLIKVIKDLKGAVNLAQLNAMAQGAVIRHIKDEDVKKLFEKLYKETGTAFAEHGMAGVMALKRVDRELVDHFEQVMEAYVKAHAGMRITWINETTREGILDAVRTMMQQAIDTGAAIPNMAEVLRQELQRHYVDIVKWRAVRIARTEVMTASNRGSIEGARYVIGRTGMAGVKKVWITAIDGREREAHREAAGQTAELDGSFIIGGEQMDHPGDPAASAANVVNCRCAIGYERQK